MAVRGQAMTPSRNLRWLLIAGLVGANALVFLFSGYWLYQSHQPYAEAWKALGPALGFLLLSLLSARFVFHFLESTLHESTLNRLYLLRASDGIHILDRQGDLIEANDRFCAMLGYTRDELLGANVSTWEAKWSTDTLKQEILPDLFGQQDISTVIETRHRRKDGEVIDVELNLSRFDAGKIAYLYASARDITERKQTQAQILALNQGLEDRVRERTQALHTKEEQLHEALALNDNILMVSAVGIAAYRLDGQCVMANPAFAELIGGSREALLAQNFRRLPSWQGSGLLDMAERVLASGIREEREVHFTTTFGHKLCVHCQFSCFSSRNEAHLLLMLNDITEKRLAEQTLVERERSFRTLADNVPDNIVRYDREGRILYLNRSLENLLGHTTAELVGKTPRETAPDGRFDALAQAVLQVARSGESHEIEQIVPGPDGAPRYHAIHLVAEKAPDGETVSVLAVGRDLTAQKMAEEELRLAASVFHYSADGVLVTDGDGRILSVNPAFTDITGYTEVEALGKTPSLLRSDRHGPDFYHQMWLDLHGKGLWQGEIWNRRKSGEAYLEWLTINRIADSNGVPVRFVAVFHDITELWKKDEHIRHMAFHDALTGLPNRALMRDRLEHALNRAQRENGRLSVIFLDLDRFKAVNDELGHDIGDLLLQEVAHRIKERLRAADTVARMGGDEFVILLEDLKDAGDWLGLVQKLILEIARPAQLNGHTVQVGASVGVAFYPEDGSDAMDLMKRADMAMYAAKAVGRNTSRTYQQTLQSADTR